MGAEAVLAAFVERGEAARVDRVDGGHTLDKALSRRTVRDHVTFWALVPFSIKGSIGKFVLDNKLYHESSGFSTTRHSDTDRHGQKQPETAAQAILRPERR